MAMTYATVTGRIVIPGTATGIPGELRATPLTVGGVLAFPTEDTVTLGPAVADVAADGTLSQDGTPGIKIPTAVPAGTLWRLVFHPKGKGNLPTRLGDFEITADTTTGDLVPVQVMAITPTVADNIAAAAALGATNDTATASFINDESSATKAALSATIGRGVSAATKAAGMVCFTWDDGYPNWLAIAQEASARGQRHTFCVTSNHIDAVDGITTADILAIHNMGHEIAAHSHTHINHATASVAARTTEFDTSKAALEAIVGVGNVTTYVYPFGSTYSPPARNNTTDREAWGRFVRLRDTSLTGFTPMDDRANAFLIPSKAWGANADALAAIRTVAERPLIWNVFAHWPDHLIGGSPDISWSTMIAAMDLAEELGVPCVTMREAYPAGSMLVNPTFDQGLAGWRTIGDAGAVSVQPMVTPPSGIKASNVIRITPTTTQFSAIAQVIPVIPGETYEMGWLVRLGTNGAGNPSFAGNVNGRWGLQTDYAGLIAGWDDGLAVTGRTRYLHSTAGDRSGAWNMMGASYTIPAGKRFVEVQLGIANATGTPIEIAHVWVGPSRFGNFG